MTTRAAIFLSLFFSHVKTSMSTLANASETHFGMPSFSRLYSFFVNWMQNSLKAFFSIASRICLHKRMRYLKLW